MSEAWGTTVFITCTRHIHELLKNSSATANFSKYQWQSIIPQVLDVLCSLCVCHGVAVRSNQHLICDNLLPRRDLLLQTRLVNHVSRYASPQTLSSLHTTASP